MLESFVCVYKMCKIKLLRSVASLCSLFSSVEFKIQNRIICINTANHCDKKKKHSKQIINFTLKKAGCYTWHFTRLVCLL